MVDADSYPSRAIICGIITRGITLQSPLSSNSTRRHRAIVDCGENGIIYQGVVSLSTSFNATWDLTACTLAPAPSSLSALTTMMVTPPST